MKSLLILLLGFTSLTFFSQSFILEKKQILTGTVTDNTSGKPLANTKITLWANGKTIATATSKKDGSYALTANAGQYEAVYTLTGYETNRVLHLVVPKNTTGYCDVRMLKATLPGQSVSWEWSSRSHGSQIKKEETTAVAAKRTEARRDASAAKSKVKSAPTGAATRDRGAVVGSDDASPEMPEPAINVMWSEEVDYDMVMAKPAPLTAPSVVTSRAEDMTSHLTADEIKTVPAKPASPNPRAGLLTAGEWNDLDNWSNHWTDLLADGEIDAHQNTYGFFPRHRYTVLLTNKDDYPVIDAVLTLTNNDGEILWEARTDNTGKAELWYGLHDKSAQAPELSVYATIDGKKQTLGKVKPAAEGLSRFTVNRTCQSSSKVDIVWAVDATGSMGDEIEYLKTELLDVIGRVKNINPGLALRMGTVFYRDITDDYVVKNSGLSTDISQTVSYIREQYAGGGGDYPEAVHTALEEAIFRQDWSSDAVARICFLVLDASPHQTPEVNASIQRSIREAARKGIRIVPVSASGIQKDTEFLMKFFGLTTNGTYLFLTDHSGIGGKHIEATTDEYKVELLNNLLVRIISQYTSIASCDGKSQVVFERSPVDSLPTTTPPQAATYYPNPAVNYVTLDLPFDAQKVTLYNAEGQAVYSLSQTTTGRHTIPVNDLPAGYYSIRIWKDNQTQSGKILVIKT